VNGAIDPTAWTIKTMPSRIRNKGDLWKDFWKKPQTLDAALEKLSRHLSSPKKK
jgi:DNA primase